MSVVFSVDRLLAGKPELRAHFVQMASDPGISGDVILAAMIEAGIAAKRSAVYNWQRQFRTVKARRGSLSARVCQAVVKLGRERLYELARQLDVPIESDGE